MQLRPRATKISQPLSHRLSPEQKKWRGFMIHIPKEINLVLLKRNFFKKYLLESNDKYNFETLEEHITGKN